MPSREYFRTYMKNRYADQKHENELYYSFRHLFSDMIQYNRSITFKQNNIRKRNIRESDPDTITGSIRVIFDTPEDKRIRAYAAVRKYNDKKYRQNYYLDTDGYVSYIRFLF